MGQLISVSSSLHHSVDRRSEMEKPKKNAAPKTKKKKLFNFEFNFDLTMEGHDEESQVLPVKETRKRVAAKKEVAASTESKAKLAPEIEAGLAKFVEETTKLGVAGLRNLFKDSLVNLCPPGASSSFESNPELNRYLDVVCLEETRVKLTLDTPPAGTSGNYIHANWVQFENHDRKFIATQAPMEKTIEDFWRMVFQEQCPTILNLTKLVEDGKAKCAQYWPEGTTGAYKNYGKMFVNIKKVEDEDKFAVYTLEVLPEGCSDSLIVKMIHVQNWPNNGLPMSGRMVLRFLRLVAKADRLASGPVVIHCSAGVGRTGTIILIDVIIQRLFKNGSDVNFAELITTLRKQRASCIQKEGQFVFLVDCCLDYIHARCPDKFVDKLTKFRDEVKAAKLGC